MDGRRRWGICRHRAAEAHTSMRQPCTQPCDLGAAQERRMTAGAYVRQSKAAENAQGHACRQVCNDNSWPATAELRGRRRSSGDTGLPGSRWQTLPGACPCQKAGSHGRRAGCAAGKHGRQRARTAGSAQAAMPERGRAGAERGARRALGEAGAPSAPGTGAGRRRPTARRRRGQTGRREDETGEQHPWRHGTARPSPGAPKGFLPPSRTPAGRTGVTPRLLHSPFAGSLLLGHGGGAAVGS